MDTIEAVRALTAVRTSPELTAARDRVEKARTAREVAQRALTESQDAFLAVTVPGGVLHGWLAMAIVSREKELRLARHVLEESWDAVHKLLSKSE